jgi:hypothetical protein
MESVCEAMFFTDIAILTATDTLRAHRSILSAHSAFLAFLLASQVFGTWYYVQGILYLVSNI